jgi:uncharacterized protein
MPTVDTLDLGSLRLASGAGRRLDLEVRIEPFELGGEPYPVVERTVPVRLDISRTTGRGYSLRLRFEATLGGACMRCLEPSEMSFAVDAREVSQPGTGEDLDSPYVSDQVLELADWARDALALTLPAKLLCKPDCAGLCPICGVDLNRAGPDHGHEAEPDSRWAKLSELKFE